MSCTYGQAKDLVCAGDSSQLSVFPFGIDPNASPGDFSWTPAEADGPGAFGSFIGVEEFASFQVPFEAQFEGWSGGSSNNGMTRHCASTDRSITLQAQDGIRDEPMCLELRRVLFRSLTPSLTLPLP